MEYQQFINWLKAKKIYNNYHKYFYDGNRTVRTYNNIKTVKELFDYDYNLMILEAFNWWDTPEKYYYWVCINYEWLDLIKKINEQ